MCAMVDSQILQLERVYSIGYDGLPLDIKSVSFCQHTAERTSATSPIAESLSRWSF